MDKSQQEIEIRHKETGAVLLRREAGTLERASLAGIDLCDADLVGVNLAGADLTGALLRGADMRRADLSRANVTGAYLLQADLSGANLSGALLFPDSLDGANLTGANLAGANLTGAYMAEATLVHANLCYANLQSAYLGGADLSRAQFAFTNLSDCPSLVQARGLDEIEHLGPSSLDLLTLRACVSTLPDAFLAGAGLTRAEIDRLRDLYATLPPQASCLLSYAAEDRPFAERLRADLLVHGVNCWPGHPAIDAGYMLQTVFNLVMKRHDRLILIGSRPSLLRPRVGEQAAAALQRERETGAPALFLVQLDDFLSSDELRGIADEKLAAGEWAEDWVHCLRAHPGTDFRHWTDAAAYPQQLQRLVDELRNPTARDASSQPAG